MVYALTHMGVAAVKGTALRKSLAKLNLRTLPVIKDKSPDMMSPHTQQRGSHHSREESTCSDIMEYNV